jgi:anaerobic magnesium-protoporphyrin IX monomethyl ester cyclase
MGKKIDVVLIGHNEIETDKHVESYRQSGENLEIFRDLDLAFINIEGKPVTVLEAFNHFKPKSAGITDVYMGETFTATNTYLGNYLHRRDLSFDFINSFKQEREHLRELLENCDVKSVAILTTLYVTITPIQEIVEFIREINDEVKIILGGPYVSTVVKAQPVEELEDLFDYLECDYYINSSQGELALSQLVRAISEDTPEVIPEINNLYYFNEDGDFTITETKVETNTLEENPINYDLFEGRLSEYVNVRTAISCPYKCSFCGFPERAGKYQTLHVDLVEEELNRIRDTGIIKNIYFIDDTFNVPKQRFKDMLRMMIKNEYKIQWHSYYRCQFSDDETISLMKEAGCEGVFLGIESGSDTILKNMNKGATVAFYKEGVAKLREVGIAAFGSFIIGFPGETEETVAETIEFIETSGLEMYRTQLWYYEHITPIAKEKDKYQIEGEGFVWKHATMDSMRATDIIDDIFKNVKNSLWLPQYGFDFDSLFHLVHRGMSMDDVKEFIALYNRGIKEKMLKINDSISPELTGEFERLFAKAFQTQSVGV